MKKRKVWSAVVTICMFASFMQPLATSAKTDSKVSITNKAELNSMSLGERSRLSVTVGGKIKKSQLVYKTTDRNVVNVSKKGSIRAVASGTAVIRVRDKKNSVSDKVTITVKAAELSIRQTGAQQFTVESPDSIAGKPIEITYGDIFINSEAVFNEETNTVILNTSAKLKEGEYQINIGGRIYQVMAEEQKPADIVFLSDKLALTTPIGVPSQTGGTTTEAEVGYKVVNQFGDDITKFYDVVANGNTNGRPNRSGQGGSISIEVPINLALGTPFTITAYVQNTEIAKTKTFALDSMNVVSDIKTCGLYNQDGLSELTMDINLYKDAFYLLFEAYDRDKNNIVYQNNAQDIIRDTMMIFLSTNVPEIYNCTDLQDKVEIKEVDGKRYFAVPITGDGYLTHGTAHLILRSIYNSAAVEENLEIGYGSAVDKITVTPPNYVALNEDTQFDYTAYDVKGNEVKDIKALNRIDTNGKYYFSMVDGTPKLYLRSTANDSVGEKNDMFRTATNQIMHVHYRAMAPARPAYIIGFKDAAYSVIGTNDLWYDMDNFTYLDQYERPINNIWASQYKDYAIELVDDKDAFRVTSDNKYITQNQSIRVTPQKKGVRSNVTFRIVNKDGSELSDIDYTLYDINLKNRTQISEYTHRMLSADLSKIKSFTVDDISDCWYEANENHSEYFKPEVRVYGILSTGDKVKLPADEFTLNLPGNTSYLVTDGNGKGGLTRYVNSDGSETRVAPDTYDEFFNPNGLDKSDFIVDGEGVTKLKREVEVVINRTGQTIVKNVNIVNEKRKIVFSYLTDPNTGCGLSSKTIEASKFNNPTQLIKEFESWFNYVDNFGIKSEVEKMNTLNYKIRVTDIQSGDVKRPASVSHNGTKNITFNNFTSGTTCNITFDFGGATSTIYIVVA